MHLLGHRSFVACDDHVINNNRPRGVRIACAACFRFNYNKLSVKLESKPCKIYKTTLRHVQVAKHHNYIRVVNLIQNNLQVQFQFRCACFRPVIHSVSYRLVDEQKTTAFVIVLVYDTMTHFVTPRMAATSGSISSEERSQMSRIVVRSLRGVFRAAVLLPTAGCIFKALT